MIKAIQNYLHNYALEKTRYELMSLTDRQLEDVGVSRGLLNEGVEKWPWREVEGQNLSAQPARMNSREIDSAIRELSRMSDKDLRDIGIDRGTIRQSVLNGIDGRGPRQAA